ncbi:cold-shock protein [Clostridium isatidis]|uniref:Cold-shock protein n=1 Tax=Clostridium isatidis TaxID=182773 RepID=A0A343JF55_9CLOT|nr:cold-shock protein [Clostridium isatidis]ASW44163.1 cold-shock protein [Clostridium isatidis]NLZ34923.1 cold-shock protein [Clostridiales bacterium]
MAEKTGVVKWYNATKGYGFISCDNGDDIFIHHSQIQEQGPDKDLHEGENVTFDIQEGKKGPMAVNLHKL